MGKVGGRDKLSVYKQKWNRPLAACYGEASSIESLRHAVLCTVRAGLHRKRLRKMALLGPELAGRSQTCECPPWHGCKCPPCPKPQVTVSDRESSIDKQNDLDRHCPHSI